MKRGFLTVVENNNSIDFVKMAYTLALSLQLTQTKVKNLSIITTEKDIPEKYIKVFDKVILVDDDPEWKEKSKSLDTTSLCASYYDLTPYDETIVLDADMIFNSDIIEWWDLMSRQDLVFTNQVKTYRNEKVTSDYYRKVFTENNLPNIYTGFFFFKKSDLNKSLFDWVNRIFENWEVYFNSSLKKKYRPDFLSADLAYSLAIQILSIDDYFLPENIGIPSFVHMKSRIQNVEGSNLKEDWTNYFSISLNDSLQLKINNFLQLLPFHYHDKQFLTEEILESYERSYSIA